MTGRCGRALGILVALVLAVAMVAPATAATRVVTIMAPDLPPMFTADGGGREGAIITETFASCGYTVKFKIVPSGRHLIDYREGAPVDAVTTVPIGAALPGSRSVVYIRYRNGASVLKSSGLRVRSLADLAGKRVITFLGAPDILPGLRDAIPTFADFHERTDQMVHSNLLFAGRIDAVLGDGLIFAEYNRQLEEKAKSGAPLPVDPTQDVVFTAIFPPTLYTIMFRDDAVRADFDRCFAELDRSGRVDAINLAVVSRYSATVGSHYLSK